MNAVTVRTAIDGVPIDMFVAAAEDGENDYVGQYNFNNEKARAATCSALVAWRVTILPVPSLWKC